MLDLTTMAERPVQGQTRSVDDQVEWLDDKHVIYAEPSDAGGRINILDVDAGGPPQVFVSQARSPVVIR